MLLDHFALAVPSQRHLLAQGLELGAYTPKGWHHQGLVNLADGLGLSGVAAHFDSPEPLQRLAQEGIPAIVSCTFTFPEDGRRGGHLVLFRGERIQLGQRVAGFADPSRWGALHDELPAERFWASWTGRAIILRPSVQASPGFGGTADLSKWIDDITTQAGVNR
ncbi:hypothetical protein [Streptomyces sp. AP-93]|uniref:hypothetical protein n=1 Tax=Streptomyces sp. AP-93 TaxID=2929048 RepID=UPI001FAEC055|nr:hypothetical protein [Streptomyces sp. AP-93]MCJ0875558.1 hypothetical protein [Streptomyces sp. AP-93]